MSSPSFSSDSAEETVSRRRPRPSQKPSARARSLWERYITYPDADPRDEQLFLSYANLRSASGTRALCFFLLAGTLGAWPFDLWVFPIPPLVVHSLSVVRVYLLLISSISA